MLLPVMFCRAVSTTRESYSKDFYFFAMISGFWLRSTIPPNSATVGNFPQAFFHLALINTAHNLASANGAVHQLARQ